MYQFLFVLLPLISTNVFSQDTDVLVKLTDNCPTNYRTNNGYCVPNNTISKYYIPKISNTCPSRYRTDGVSGYCISLDDNVNDIPILKSNSNCPSGYRTDGTSGYCIK